MNHRFIKLVTVSILLTSLKLFASPVDRILENENDRKIVLKYYESQYGSDRRDEMLTEALKNVAIVDILSPKKSETEILGSSAQHEISRLLLSYAGEDYFTASPFMSESTGTYSEPSSNFDSYSGVLIYRSYGGTNGKSSPCFYDNKGNYWKNDILKSAKRGGLSSMMILGEWKLKGEEVIKDYVGGHALLLNSAFSSSKNSYVYAYNDRSSPEALLEFLKLATDRSSPFFGWSLNHAIELSKSKMPTNYITVKYVYNNLHKIDDEKTELMSYRYDIEHEFRIYEEKYGSEREDWWNPWSKARSEIATINAEKIMQDFKGQKVFHEIWYTFDKDRNFNRDIWNETLELAHLGNSISMYDVGIAYLSGIEDFPINKKEARKWFRLSSSRGFVPGSYNYAICLIEGIGGPIDTKEAFKLFKYGALRCDQLSQYNLGVAYATGKGVDRDYTEAAAWWILCQAKVPEAKSSLAKLASMSDRSIVDKAKVRAETLRTEISANLDELKRQLIW